MRKCPVFVVLAPAAASTPVFVEVPEDIVISGDFLAGGRLPETGAGCGDRSTARVARAWSETTGMAAAVLAA